MAIANRMRKSSTSSLTNTKHFSHPANIFDNKNSASLADSGIEEISTRPYSISGAISPPPRGRISVQESSFSKLRSLGSREYLDRDNIELNNRRKSCFESGTLPANLKSARLNMDPQATLDLLNRQVNLEKREKELVDATREALAKAEEAEKLFNKMAEQDKELEELRTENEILQNELNIKTGRIEELEMHISEQREQLASMRQRAAQVQSEADKMKVSHMALDNSSPYEDLLAKYEHVSSERDQLIANFDRMKEQFSQLKTENASLKSTVTALRKVKQQEEEKIEEDRDKAQLLSVIREKIDEKVQWERYACDLVYRIVTRDPAMLETVTNRSSEEGHVQNGEACWEAYARALLSEVMNKAPHILHELDVPDNYTDSYSVSECFLETG